MTDYNLLPFAPNAVNMAGTDVKNLTSILIKHSNNRTPSPRELKNIFSDNEYLLEEEIDNGNSFEFRITEPYSPFNTAMSVNLTKGKDKYITISNSDLIPALDLSKCICKEFGPFYFGYNGFDTILVIDHQTENKNIIDSIRGDSKDEKWLFEIVKREGMMQEASYDDSDPVHKKLIETSNFIKCMHLLCDIIEEAMVKSDYTRRGLSFFKFEEHVIKTIHPIAMNSIGEGRFYISARFDLMDKRTWEKEGIIVEGFPTSTYFHRTELYPTKQDFIDWEYKHPKIVKVTNPEWVEYYRDELVVLSEKFPELVESYFKT